MHIMMNRLLIFYTGLLDSSCQFEGGFWGEMGGVREGLRIFPFGSEAYNCTKSPQEGEGIRLQLWLGKLPKILVLGAVLNLFGTYWDSESFLRFADFEP